MDVPKERKYKLAKQLIESGSLTSFAEVVDYVKLVNISRDSGISYNTLRNKVKNTPWNFTLADYRVIAKLFQIEPTKLMELTIADDDLIKKQLKHKGK
jgi:hypothetical protein